MAEALEALFVFAALVALDFVWARYTLATTDGHALLSSTYATAIILLNGAAAISYTQRPWLLVPAAMGAFVGTYLAVRLKRKPT